MYLNDGLQITNSPTAIRGVFNTWPMVVTNPEAKFYHVPRTYVDQHGNTVEYRGWNAPRTVQELGSRTTTMATPTPTKPYYARNTFIAA